MSIVLYGGGFNPPHLGHLAAADCAWTQLRPERFFVVPDGIPPHKPLPEGTPDGETRLALCRAAFADRPWAEVLDDAVRRDSPCYMIDTVRALQERIPEKDWILLLGADMFLYFDHWYRAEELASRCRLAVLSREEGEDCALREHAQRLKQQLCVDTVVLEHRALPMSSSEIRAVLPQRLGREKLTDRVYRAIIQQRLYGAKPELSWLRDQVYNMLPPERIPHVEGCEGRARELAMIWGFDPDAAAEAGILHDMTKKWSWEEQLRFCEEQKISLTQGERENPQLLHARTGAVAARLCFGAEPEICQAIRWHTTGKPEMNLLEKILYLADMTESTRHFSGVEELRKRCEEDLDAAMADALRISVESIRRRGMFIYKDTQEACQWYAERVLGIKEEKTC